MSTWFLWWPLTESHHNVCDLSAVDFVNLNSNFKDSLFDIIIDNTDVYQQYVAYVWNINIIMFGDSY